MLAEPSPYEEVGELADGCGARVEREQRALDVLERRLGRFTWESGRAESGLHPGIGGDDRAAQVRVGAQIVERLVEGRREHLGRSATLPASESRAGTSRGGEHTDPEQQTQDDHELLPAEVDVLGLRAGFP